jgi:hypothetical protein
MSKRPEDNRRPGRPLCTAAMTPRRPRLTLQCHTITVPVAVRTAPAALARLERTATGLAMSPRRLQGGETTHEDVVLDDRGVAREIKRLTNVRGSSPKWL